jgi:hypothetical protein
VTALFGLCMLAMEASSVAHAWPQFLRVGRGTPTDAPSHQGGVVDRATAHHSPLPIPGKTERAEQARALWQDIEAKGRLSPCWKRSLLLMHAKCTEVQKDDTMRSRLALFMATCDADSDGRVHPSFHCGTTASAPSQLPPDGVRMCVRGLSDTAYAAFLQYRLHADVLCAYLQEELYQERTEAAVAAMLQEMESSTAVLSGLQESGTEMMALVKDTQALQRHAQEATAALQQQLNVVREGHTAALQALRAASGDILRTSTRTDAVLVELHAHVQAAAEEALASVQALREQSVQQLAAMQEQTRGVVRLLAQVDHLQHLLTRPSFSWHRVLGVVGCVTAVLVATSVPRTTAARLPALAVTLIGTVGLPLLQWWTGREAWLLLRTPTWQSLCATWTVGLVCRAALRYVQPEAWQRRVIREEAERVWRDLHNPAADPSKAVLQPYALRAPPLALRPLPPGPSRVYPWTAPLPLHTHNAARGSPSPAPVPPLSIAVSPLQSDDNDGEADAESVSTIAAAAATTSRDAKPPPYASTANGGKGKDARKRGRTAAAKGDDDSSEPAPQVQRADTAIAVPLRATTAVRQRGSKRAGSKTPRKKT